MLVFARNRTDTPPSRLDVGDIDAMLVAAFLNPSANRARQQRVHPQRPAVWQPAEVNTATYARFGMAMIDHDTYAALGV